MYEELQEYAKIHHDCLVPRRYRGSGPQHLGSWANFQHAWYKSKNNNSKASTITDEIRNQTGRDGPCAHPACKVCAQPYLATILLSTSSIFSSRRTFLPIRRPNFVTWSRCEPAEHAVLYPAGGAVAHVNTHSSTFPPSGPLAALPGGKRVQSRQWGDLPLWPRHPAYSVASPARGPKLYANSKLARACAAQTRMKHHRNKNQQPQPPMTSSISPPPARKLDASKGPVA